MSPRAVARQTLSLSGKEAMIPTGSVELLSRAPPPTSRFPSGQARKVVFDVVALPPETPLIKAGRLKSKVLNPEASRSVHVIRRTDLAAVTERCMEKDPDDRPATAAPSRRP